MALNVYNFKKWYRMLSGRSVMHVNQGLGKCICADKLNGYYNNLTEKVTMLPSLLETDELPLYKTPSGKEVTFPVDVFQYGLGAYDLWLLEKDERYLRKFKQCVEWTLNHQEESGAWCNFFFKYPAHPYGAMAQGEAVSLLLRGYEIMGREELLVSARKALDFMLNPLTDEMMRHGNATGTTLYHGDDVVLSEYTHLPVVLNGWIFAWWGLYDYVLVTQDTGRYRQLMEKSEESLRRYLKAFSTSYWSKYDLSGKIASPFYHRLHIAQMQAMYILTHEQTYNAFAHKWEEDLNHPLKKGFAFVQKAWQKINEKEAWAKD